MSGVLISHVQVDEDAGGPVEEFVGVDSQSRNPKVETTEDTDNTDNTESLLVG